MLVLLLATLSLLSTTLTAWQWTLGRRFPLNQRLPPAHPPPALPLLQPLKGRDSETETCLVTWFQQHYPGPLQILFGVDSADDPAVPLVRSLIAQHPQIDAQLVVCPHPLGPNGKVSTLAQLWPLARHPLAVVSDADTAVPTDLLEQLATRASQPSTGLVGCLYRLATPATLSLRWEAVTVNADFWSQVLQSRTLAPQDFGLGAVMALRRDVLDRVGGFAPLTPFLADDFELGQRVTRAGWTIDLCPVVVDCREPAQGWREVWRHQIRWARTIRACRPFAWFASILANGTLAPLALALATCLPPAPAGLALATLSLTLRLLAACHLQARFAPATRPWRYPWMVPLHDLLAAAVWLLSFLGSRVEWRGRRFHVRPDGTLRSSSALDRQDSKQFQPVKAPRARPAARSSSPRAPEP